MALAMALNNVTKLSPEDRDRLRMQILRQLIDETLQIQEAKSAEITVTAPEIDRAYARFAAVRQDADADDRLSARGRIVRALDAPPDRGRAGMEPLPP